MREAHVLGIGLDTGAARTVVLLQEAGGSRRVLPIWIGTPEASALELAALKITATRPGAHELIGTLISLCGRQLERVAITTLCDAVFHAELVLDGDTHISARPGDAVILALRLDAAIEVADSVLDEAGVAHAHVVDASGAVYGGADPMEHTVPTKDEVPTDDEVEEMRRFLDATSPTEFDD